jgi:hypothetical protein
VHAELPHITPCLAPVESLSKVSHV